MALASDSRRFFASAWPATASRVSRGWMNSISPWHDRSMRSFFLAANSGPSGGEPSRADIVITARRLSSVRPPATAAVRFTASICAAGTPAADAVNTANRSRSSALGSGTLIVVTAGLVTSAGCISTRLSVSSTIATLTRRSSGLVAQLSMRTSRPAPARALEAASPVGARY